MQALIGIDIGTTGTKAAIFDEEGNLLAESYIESNLYYPRPGWVEQNPEEFYDTTVQTIRDIVSKTNINPKDVKSICIDGQMAGILGIDADYEPVTRYDSWLDNRCSKYVEYIKQNFEEEVMRTAGLPSTVAHCAKILWWKNEEPETYARIDKFIQPAAFVAGKLAGLKGKDAFIDYTYLHFTGLYDAATTKWSEKLLKAFDIEESKMPEIVEPWKVIGTLTKDVANACGLTTGTAIVAGMGDQAAGFLGAGLVEPGLIVDVAGTASVFACCVDKFNPDLKHKTLLFPKAASKGLWFPHAYIGGGGLCLRWFRDGIVKPTKEQLEEAYNMLNEEAKDVKPGTDGLLFVPHLGGRNYPYNNEIRGTWAGFSWGHERKHFYKSMMEAIAYEYYYYLSIEKELFKDMQFKEVRVIGGGSKSQLFNQIKADVLGIPYVQVSRTEVGVLGSAICAGYGVGIYKDMEQTAKSFVTTKNCIEPNEKNTKIYQEYANVYLEMIQTMEPIYKKIYQLNNRG
ncbi:MAG: xylB [Clostridia bacterium]|jgi:xylulokinase|nr:xylB [Clostridia bacterium]